LWLDIVHILEAVLICDCLICQCHCHNPPNCYSHAGRYPSPDVPYLFLDGVPPESVGLTFLLHTVSRLEREHLEDVEQRMVGYRPHHALDNGHIVLSVPPAFMLSLSCACRP